MIQWSTTNFYYIMRINFELNVAWHHRVEMVLPAAVSIQYLMQCLLSDAIVTPPIHSLPVECTNTNLLDNCFSDVSNVYSVYLGYILVSQKY